MDVREDDRTDLSKRHHQGKKKQQTGNNNAATGNATTAATGGRRKHKGNNKREVDLVGEAALEARQYVPQRLLTHRPNQ